jgi:hypothetical protein
MSWIMTPDHDLINLDQVEMLSIEELEQVPEGAPDEARHGVALWLAGEESVRFAFIGTEAECKQIIEQISNKLPLVKGVL